MKPFIFALALAVPLAATAGFESWTNQSGQTAQLELVKKVEKDGEPAGEFRMRDGRVTVLKVSTLDEASQAKFSAATVAAADTAAATPAAGPAKASVFDEVLDGNLVQLNGKSVRKAADVAKPTKFYVFYYSASWCGPCQAYTPELVKLYNKIKPGNDKFELVFISSDQDEESQEGYMKGKKMPWPALKFSRIEKFTKAFDHGVSGIPSVIVCDLEGNIVSRVEAPAALEKLLTE